jgi:Flp pilus assembly protein TadB
VIVALCVVPIICAGLAFAFCLWRSARRRTHLVSADQRARKHYAATLDTYYQFPFPKENP